jgi:hypothetical protein
MAETDRDPPDTNFLVLLVIAFVCIFSLAFAIFPRHEATATAPTAASAPDKK